MPCDGQNPNCDRRRELLAQLKCLISSMEKKKACEWDEPPCPPPVICSALCTSNVFDCIPIKQCKSFDFRASIIRRCECIKRNGLQDKCMMWDCMGRPECMTKLYPVCMPGRNALLKLTDLGDMEIALRKFYCADQAREAALAAYCRLACNNTAEICCSNKKPICSNNMICKPTCIEQPFCLPSITPCTPAYNICFPCSPPCPPSYPSSCSPPCSSSCLLPCPSACLPPCPPACLPPCPPACLPPCPPACLPACPSACSPTCSLTCLTPCPPPLCSLSCPPLCLSMCPSPYLSICPLSC